MDIPSRNGTAAGGIKMSGKNRYDFAVAGTGIVGLATAFYLQKRFPGSRLLLLEKEAGVARHQTGRNSGVIHSGIYYKPGSFKAKNCVEGYRLLLDFLKENDIPYHLSGKLIVATEESETAELKRLYENGLKNGLRRIALLDAKEMRELEPDIRGIAAIHVPYTGVTDYRAVSRKLQGILEKGGAEFAFKTRIHRIMPGQPVEIHTSQGTYFADKVIVAAGLYSDKLYGGDEFRIIPFRGEYYYLRPPWADKVRTMVYPVPDPRFPFLGIHLTRHIDGSVSAGPSAVLAWGREAYGCFDLHPGELLETLRYPGFRQLARKYAKTGLQEMLRSWFKPLFARSVRKFLPDFPVRALYGYHSGIRAQLVDRSGRLVDDFVMRKRENVTYILNAPSPAATASLAIGKQVVEGVVSEM